MYNKKNAHFGLFCLCFLNLVCFANETKKKNGCGRACGKAISHCVKIKNVNKKFILLDFRERSIEIEKKFAIKYGTAERDTTRICNCKLQAKWHNNDILEK